MQKCVMHKNNINTKKKYQTALNNLQKYITQRNQKTETSEHIIDITNDNIKLFMKDYQAYLEGLDTIQPQRKLSNNTINQYMILTRKFFEDYCEIEIEKLEKLKVTKHAPKYLTADAVDIIISYIEQSKTDADIKSTKMKMLDTDKVMINLLFNTGLRIHEALKLELDDIQSIEADKNGLYPLEIVGKGSKARTIIITAEVYAELTGYVEEYCSGNKKYVFESQRTGNPITARAIEKNFCNLAKEIDTRYNLTGEKKSYSNLLKPHNLRHSYAVDRLNRNVPINAMQKLLGHANVQTTQIYTDISAETLSDIIAESEIV